MKGIYTDQAYNTAGHEARSLSNNQAGHGMSYKNDTAGTDCLGYRSNVLPDRPEIRGMIARVPHLVTVEEVAG